MKTLAMILGIIGGVLGLALTIVITALDYSGTIGFYKKAGEVTRIIYLIYIVSWNFVFTITGLIGTAIYKIKPFPASILMLIGGAGLITPFGRVPLLGFRQVCGFFLLAGGILAILSTRKVLNIKGLNETTKMTHDVQAKYHALRTVAGIIKAVAWITFILTLVGGIIVGGLLLSVDQEGQQGDIIRLSGLLTIIVSIISGVYGLVITLASSEVIKLFIDMEENTRLTNKLLQRSIGIETQKGAEESEDSGGKNGI